MIDCVIDDNDASKERWKYFKKRYPKMNIQLNEISYDKNGRGK